MRLVSTRDKPLNSTEIQRALGAAPAIISPKQLAALLGVSTKTIYHWIGADRLNGAFRRRGKHCLIWRDRALACIFNGRDW